MNKEILRKDLTAVGLAFVMAISAFITPIVSLADVEPEPVEVEEVDITEPVDTIEVVPESASETPSIIPENMPTEETPAPHTHDLGYLDNGDDTHVVFCKSEGCDYQSVESHFNYENGVCICGAVYEAESVEEESEELAVEDAPILSPETSYTETVDNVSVSVSAPAGVFPENTTFVITPVEVDDSIFEELIDENKEITKTISFDITAFCDGVEVQPNTEYGSVSVLFENVDIPKDSDVFLAHLSEDLGSVDELLDNIIVSEDAVSFDAEHFSVYTCFFTASDSVLNSINNKETCFFYGEVEVGDKIYFKDIFDTISENYYSQFADHNKILLFPVRTTYPSDNYTAYYHREVTMSWYSFYGGELEQAYIVVNDDSAENMNVPVFVLNMNTASYNSNIYQRNYRFLTGPKTEYTITYIMRSNNEVLSTETVTLGSKASRPGYGRTSTSSTQLRDYYEKEGDNYIAFDASTEINRDYILYTEMPTSTYTIYYYTSDGKTLLHTETLTYPDTTPKYVNETYGAWSTVKYSYSSLVNFATDMHNYSYDTYFSGVNRSISVYGLPICTVTYKDYTGTVVIHTESVVSGQKVNYVHPEGHRWVVEQGGHTTYATPILITTDKTIYEEAPYVVTYYDRDGEVIHQDSAWYGEVITLYTHPDGLRWVGSLEPVWNHSPITTKNISGDTSIYTEPPYTVTYYSSDGASVMHTEEVSYGRSATYVNPYGRRWVKSSGSHTVLNLTNITGNKSAYEEPPYYVYYYSTDASTLLYREDVYYGEAATYTNPDVSGWTNYGNGQGGDASLSRITANKYVYAKPSYPDLPDGYTQVLDFFNIGNISGNHSGDMMWNPAIDWYDNNVVAYVITDDTNSKKALFFYGTGEMGYPDPSNLSGGYGYSQAYPWYNHNGFTEVFYSEGITSITGPIMEPGITTVSFPSTATTINPGAFAGDANLSLNESAFTNITTIGDYAFRQTSTYLYNLPASITSIGRDCIGLYIDIVAKNAFTDEVINTTPLGIQIEQGRSNIVEKVDNTTVQTAIYGKFGTIDNTQYLFSDWAEYIVTYNFSAGETEHKEYVVYYEPIDEFEATFMQTDGTVISTHTYNTGEAIAVPTESQVVFPETAGKAFILVGWKDINSRATYGKESFRTAYFHSDLMLKPVFEEADASIEYTVKFISEDVTISEETYHYGDLVIAPANPTKAPSAEYIFSFSGWDKPVSKYCMADATYYAVFRQASGPRLYNISLRDFDGNTIVSSGVQYGFPVSSAAGFSDYDLFRNYLIDAPTKAYYYAPPNSTFGNIDKVYYKWVSGQTSGPSYDRFKHYHCTGLKASDGTIYDWESLRALTVTGNESFTPVFEEKTSGTYTVKLYDQPYNSGDPLDESKVVMTWYADAQDELLILPYGPVSSYLSSVTDFAGGCAFVVNSVGSSTNASDSLRINADAYFLRIQLVTVGLVDGAIAVRPRSSGTVPSSFVSGTINIGIPTAFNDIGDGNLVGYPWSIMADSSIGYNNHDYDTGINAYFGLDETFDVDLEAIYGAAPNIPVIEKSGRRLTYNNTWLAVNSEGMTFATLDYSVSKVFSITYRDLAQYSTGFVYIEPGYDTEYIPYTVKILNRDGSIYMERTDAKYGDMIQFPTLSDIEDRFYTYKFKGWVTDSGRESLNTRTATVVTGDATYRPVYMAVAKSPQNNFKVRIPVSVNLSMDGSSRKYGGVVSVTVDLHTTDTSAYVSVTTNETNGHITLSTAGGDEMFVDVESHKTRYEASTMTDLGDDDYTDTTQINLISTQRADDYAIGSYEGGLVFTITASW